MRKQAYESSKHKKFTDEEDRKLQDLVRKHGAKKWNNIAKMMPGRTGRQCRDRFQNYLNPKFVNKSWTPEEDHLLYEKLFEVGPRYKQLARFFPNRSHNNVTNRLKNSFFSQVIASIRENSQEESSSGEKVESSAVASPMAPQEETISLTKNLIEQPIFDEFTALRFDQNWGIVENDEAGFIGLE